MLTDLNSLDFPSRRMFLEYAAKTMLGVTVVPGLMGLRGATAFAADDSKAKDKGAKKPASSGSPRNASAKHVIFLYMNGAMTHLDTFDLKPGRETQGETKGINTNV
ncbi:MAG: DUF1501 domain-containing protein, partial [Candidatus Saccharimonas sp.]|nr:DUF1501 domain-containing protein [Planctomycetaceae bacterium]